MTNKCLDEFRSYKRIACKSMHVFGGLYLLVNVTEYVSEWVSKFMTNRFTEELRSYKRTACKSMHVSCVLYGMSKK